MSRLPVSRAAAVALLAAALGGCALISLERLTVTVWPRDANAVLPLGSSPWIQFPSTPDQASVQRLFMLSAPTGSVAGDFRWATGNRMYFDPAPPLSPGVRYVLQFSGRVTLTDGGSFDANEEVPFYILHAGGGPLLQSVSPANGADAGTVTPLVLVFSAAVDPDSFAREFTVQPSAETIATWDVTGRQATLTPRDSWSTLTTYTWTVTKDLTAPDGTPTGTEYTGRFRIQLDATAPSVISVLPGLRSTFAPTGTLLADDVLLITFSEDVTDDSLMSALTISPTTKGTLFRVASGPPAVFAFVPDSQWVMDQSYTLRIGTGLADLSGNKLSTPYETSFAPAITLQVVSSIQASGSTWTVFNTLDAKPLTVDVDGNVTLSVTFAEPFTLDTEVRLASGILFDAYFPSSVTAPSLLSVSWSGGTVLTLTYAGMTRSTPTTDDYYKLTIPGGAPASDNGSGSFLKDDVWLYFLTAQ